MQPLFTWLDFAVALILVVVPVLTIAVWIWSDHLFPIEEENQED